MREHVPTVLTFLGAGALAYAIAERNLILGIIGGVVVGGSAIVLLARLASGNNAGDDER